MKKTRGHDLAATIEQSAANKVIAAPAYPLTVFDRNWPFRGDVLESTADKGDIVSYEYTATERKRLFKEAENIPGCNDLDVMADDAEGAMARGLVLAGAETIASAKRYLDAIESNPEQVTGPDPELARKILDGGVSELGKLTRGVIRAHLAWARVVLPSAPSISLGLPRSHLRDLSALVSATGELWAKLPKWVCVKKCWWYKLEWEWRKTASITVCSVKLKANAFADAFPRGAVIVLRGAFEKLRLDYPILDKLPLEGVVNRELAEKLVKTFDCGQFIATIPVISSTFKIDSIALPPTEGALQIQMTIKET